MLFIMKTLVLAFMYEYLHMKGTVLIYLQNCFFIKLFITEILSMYNYHKLTVSLSNLIAYTYAQKSNCFLTQRVIIVNFV